MSGRAVRRRLLARTSRLRCRPARRRRDEGGTATAFVVGFAIVLIAAAGLVIDGGAALNARMRLADDVEQAARAGAQHIDLATLRRTGRVVIDQPAAADAARNYLLALGYTDIAPPVANADTVAVQARDTVSTTTLGLIGFDAFHIEASATAQAVTQ